MGSRASYLHLKPHTTNELQRRVKDAASALCEDVRAVAEADLAAALETLGWPLAASGDEKLLESKVGPVEAAAGLLIRLQLQSTIGSGEFVDDLWAIDVMARALKLRFAYHFSGDRDTNRPERPEWFLSFATKTLRAHIPFILRHVQPVASHQLELYGRGHSFVDTPSQLCRVIVRACIEQLDANFDAVAAASKSVMCHCVDEVLKADKVLREAFMYPGDTVAYPPIFSYYTRSKKSREAWFGADAEEARHRVDGILQDPSAWNEPSKGILRVLDSGERINSRDSALTVASDRFIDLLAFLGSNRIAYLSHDARTRAMFAGRVVAPLIDLFASQAMDDVRELCGQLSTLRSCGPLNALAHLESAVRDWNDYDPMYSDLTPKYAAPSAVKRAVGKIVGRVGDKISSKLKMESLEVRSTKEKKFCALRSTELRRASRKCARPSLWAAR